MSALATPVELDSMGAHTFAYTSKKTPPAWEPQNGRPSEDNNNNNNNGTIVAGVTSILVLIIIALVIYKCTISHEKTNKVEKELCGTQEEGRGPMRSEHDDGADIVIQDLEAQGSSYEADVVVCTARQARLYGPGSASMVDIRRQGRGGGGERARRRGGKTGSSDSISSSPSVVDVDSLPDLYGAQALLTQGGGRAARDHLSLMEALNDESMTSSLKGESVTDGNMSRSKDESAEPLPKAERKRRRNVLRKRVASKKLLGDMLKVYAA